MVTPMEDSTGVAGGRRGFTPLGSDPGGEDEGPSGGGPGFPPGDYDAFMEHVRLLANPVVSSVVDMLQLAEPTPNHATFIMHLITLGSYQLNAGCSWWEIWLRKLYDERKRLVYARDEWLRFYQEKEEEEDDYIIEAEGRLVNGHYLPEASDEEEDDEEDVEDEEEDEDEDEEDEDDDEYEDDDEDEEEDEDEEDDEEWDEQPTPQAIVPAMAPLRNIMSTSLDTSGRRLRELDDDDGDYLTEEDLDDFEESPFEPDEDLPLTYKDTLIQLAYVQKRIKWIREQIRRAEKAGTYWSAAPLVEFFEQAEAERQGKAFDHLLPSLLRRAYQEITLAMQGIGFAHKEAVGAQQVLDRWQRSNYSNYMPERQRRLPPLMRGSGEI